MSKEKLFTPKELKEIGRKTLDVLQDAIDSGDKEKAKKLSRRMYNEFLGMHDLYRDWVTALLSWIGRKHGDEELYDAVNESYGDYTRRLSRFYAGKSEREKMEMLIFGIRGHLTGYEVEEDDEKFTIWSDCFSGGRQVKDGLYGPPANYLKVKKAQPMTFGQTDFPVYCTHCYIQCITSLESIGGPLFILKPSDDIGKKPCKLTIYKKK